MKIVPASHPNVTSTPVTRPAAAPSAPFERFLDDGADLQQERRERAFGFSELGMFGAAAATATAATPMTVVPQMAHSPGTAPQLIAAMPGQTAPSSLVTPTNAHGSAARKPTQPILRPSQLTLRRGSFQPFAGVTSATAREVQADGEGTSPGLGKSAARRHAAPGQPKPLRLVVNEQNGAIQILAGSPELSPEARERLRKAVVELAAEFGVTLARFTLNGSSIEPMPLFRIGAPDGHHRG